MTAISLDSPFNYSVCIENVDDASEIKRIVKIRKFLLFAQKVAEDFIDHKIFLDINRFSKAKPPVIPFNAIQGILQSKIICKEVDFGSKLSKKGFIANVLYDYSMRKLYANKLLPLYPTLFDKAAIEFVALPAIFYKSLFIRPVLDDEYSKIVLLSHFEPPSPILAMNEGCLSNGHKLNYFYFAKELKSSREVALIHFSIQNRICKIENLKVLIEFQKKGIGTLLLIFACFMAISSQSFIQSKYTFQSLPFLLKFGFIPTINYQQLSIIQQLTLIHNLKPPHLIFAPNPDTLQQKILKILSASS